MILCIAAALAVEITSIDLYEYRIPRTRVFATAKGSTSVTSGIFIRIHGTGADGSSVTSWGDALPRQNVTNESMADAWAAADAFSRALVGRALDGNSPDADLATVEQWIGDLRGIASESTLTFSNPPAPHRQLRATLAGFDIALLGLAAAKHHVPIHQILGGPVRDGVAISGLTANVGLTPDEGRDRVASTRSDYRCIRLKIGLDRDADLEMLKAVATEINTARPDLEIFVDVNQAWKDAATSITELSRIRAMLKATGYHGRFICEQPTHEDDFEALAAITAETRRWAADDPFRILIMADESLWDRADLARLIQLDACDAVNFKVQKAGGLLETQRMGEMLAREKPDWETYVGGLVMTDVGATANLHLGHSLPRLDYMTGAMARTADTVNPATRRLRYHPGTRTLVMPDAPGLGTGVDLEKITPHIRRTTTITR